MPNIDDALTAVSLQLLESDSARLDAELLLCAVLDKPRTYLYTWPDKSLSDEEFRQFEKLVVRRAAGEPVAHILGERGFWTLDLRVTADTLIPRPETELLVEVALAHLPGSGGRVADLGTGSGAIALAIASECPSCEVVAVERSVAALEVAQDNALRTGLDNVALHQGSWYQPLNGQRFDLIASNPPYICAEDPHLDEGDVRFEPITALASGVDGLDDIRLIIAGAGEHLEPGGWLLLEHGYDQGEEVCSLMKNAGFTAVSDKVDLQGHGRVALGQMLV